MFPYIVVIGAERNSYFAIPNGLGDPEYLYSMKGMPVSINARTESRDAIHSLVKEFKQGQTVYKDKRMFDEATLDAALLRIMKQL
jgi:hypothetical protein